MKSWITSANEHPDWSIYCLPFGRFSKKNGGDTRAATRLGDTVVDLRALSQSGFIKSDGHESLEASDLAPFAALPYKQRRDIRLAIQSIFAADSKPSNFPGDALLDITDVTMHLPMRIGDYTDFCISIEHMKNAGRTVSGNARIPPQMPWVPIGYHGRSSSIVPSGTAFKRPCGQYKISPDADSPIVAPSRRMDYEVELAFYVSQPTKVGQRVRIEDAWESIFGAVLMNDWSARDIQGYEMTPLGPFQGKNFCTTVSDWVVTLDALKPFETDLPQRLADEPKFLQHTTNKAHDIDITVEIRNGDKSGFLATKINATEFYWSMPQLLAAQGISGCNVNTGDLIATGTCSGTSDDSLGSLVELSDGGRKPWSNGTLKNRTFLEDGDEVIMTARCSKGGIKIGFGQCSGTILAAEAL